MECHGLNGKAIDKAAKSFNELKIAYEHYKFVRYIRAPKRGGRE